MEDLPQSLSLPSKHFVCLLAFDANSIPDRTIREFAKSVLAQGLSYFCAWGPDCERVHDLLDEMCDPDPTDESVVMTTWHTDDTLDDALWYFLYSTLPAEDYWDSSKAALAITVANPEWAGHIQTRLADVRALSRDVLDADGTSAT